MTKTPSFPLSANPWADRCPRTANSSTRGWVSTCCRTSYQRRTNLDQIARTEDVLLGLRAGGRIGIATEAIGSDRDALMLSAYVRDGWDLSPGDSFFVGATASGRIETDGLRNGVLAAEARYYNQTSQRTKFFATVNGTVTEQLDQEQQLLLGGDNGLRGYPLRYQAGTSLGAADARAALLHRLVSVAPVPRRRCRVLRRGADVGHRRDRCDQ